jgi:hypothetical protein
VHACAGSHDRRRLPDLRSTIDTKTHFIQTFRVRPCENEACDPVTCTDAHPDVSAYFDHMEVPLARRAPLVPIDENPEEEWPLLYSEEEVRCARAWDHLVVMCRCRDDGCLSCSVNCACVVPPVRKWGSL